MKYLMSTAIALLILINTTSAADDVFSKVTHHNAGNDGVKIHYVSLD